MRDAPRASARQSGADKSSLKKIARILDMRRKYW